MIESCCKQMLRGDVAQPMAFGHLIKYLGGHGRLAANEVVHVKSHALTVRGLQRRHEVICELLTGGTGKVLVNIKADGIQRVGTNIVEKFVLPLHVVFTRRLVRAGRY
ncbi:hypothetical protein RHOFW104T7_06450 [Rhodanobacter thiooxydans]|uniref:Uncharacterized protein n=1 Tax=Rhodanobacter thiooxydans TaxID=416169 RepID=A0A154QL19_9GAMM|nr:hypothetical protein RHOFW104T7_06450 [Rhodanobacter thiooxydans]